MRPFGSRAFNLYNTHLWLSGHHNHRLKLQSRSYALQRPQTKHQRAQSHERKQKDREESIVELQEAWRRHQDEIRGTAVSTQFVSLLRFCATHSRRSYHNNSSSRWRRELFNVDRWFQFIAVNVGWQAGDYLFQEVDGRRTYWQIKWEERETEGHRSR